jgi:predicted short-subunit dehydrogenase-like oxidoreductase (DUF2520 family)
MKDPQTLSIIGAGRLGAALGRALAARGYAVGLVVSRHLSAARRAARLITPRPPHLAFEQLKVCPDSDLLIIATPDGAIAEVAAQLAALDSSRRPRVALHLSGALASDVLAPLEARGFAVGSLHPLLSVSDSINGAEALSQANFCLEGQPRALRAARAIVRALGAKSFSLSAENKPLYHAAAVMSAGHLVALFDLAAGLLTRCGLPEKEARAVLRPLAESAVANLSRQTPAAALTGPFARADAATIEKHLRVLPPEARAAYLALGRHAITLAREQGADQFALQKIIDLLER